MKPPLTAAQVAEAARLYRGGASLDDVSRRLGRHKDTVRPLLVAAGVEIRQRGYPKGRPRRTTTDGTTT